MNKINILRILSKKKIDFALLSSNNLKELKNNSKDIDIFIPSYSKKKFKDILKKYNFFERVEKIRGYKDRKFYLNVKNKNKYLIDAYFKLDFRKNFLTTFKFLKQNDLIKTRKLRNGIYFTDTKYFKHLFKAKNLKKSTNEYLNSKNGFLKNINLSITFNKNKKSNYILFIGSDGSGKTTQIDYFIRKFFMKSIKFNLGLGKNHWYLKLNYLLYELFKISFLKKLIFIIDIILRKLAISRYSSNKIILIDRYPGYVFYKNNLINKIIKILLPKPNLVILMTAKANIRRKRKPKEYIKDEKKWFELANKIGVKFAKVDTSNKKVSENYKFIEQIFLSNNENFKNIFSESY